MSSWPAAASSKIRRFRPVTWISQLKLALPAPGARIRTLRLATGLTLFAYLVTHYLNHAVGLVSV
jgi:hypothetical protein